MDTVLILDPSPMISEPLAVALRQAGFEVHGASNANDALAMTSVRMPDLIIMELLLPGGDGSAFLHRLRASPGGARVPVILLTSVSDRSQLKRAIMHNISGIMLKQGFSLSALLQKSRLAVEALRAEAQTPPAAPPESHDATTTPPRAVPADAALPPPPDAPSSAGVLAREDPAKALASLKPIVSRSELKKILDGVGEIKAYSATVSHIMRITSSSACSIDRVVDAVKMDHALALKVLKLANSSVYSRGEPVESIKMAVLRIGVIEIRQAVMNLAIIEAFSNAEVGRSIDFHQFWEHGIACGLIAAELARMLERKDTDTAFTMGLLHDVGRMVLAEQLGDRYAQVLRTAREMDLPLELVEKRMLLFDHAEVMDRILRAWRFPKALINPIVFHHCGPGTLRKAAPRELQEAAILALANRMAHCLMLGSSGNGAIYPTAELMKMLNLGEEAIAAIENDIPQQTNTMKFSMLSTSDIAAWPQAREIHRGEIGHEFRPLFVSADVHKSALGVFFRRLRRDFDEGKPNLAVAKIESFHDLRPVSRMLIEEENAAGVGRLPLVVLSPAAKLELDPDAMADRAARRLPFPLTTRRLFEVISELLQARRPAVPQSEAA